MCVLNNLSLCFHLINNEYVFKQQLDTDPRVQSSRLESIIIMPIQRIPRYKLLLEDLLKRTPESHPDSNLLKVFASSHSFRMAKFLTRCKTGST